MPLGLTLPSIYNKSGVLPAGLRSMSGEPKRAAALHAGQHSGEYLTLQDCSIGATVHRDQAAPSRQTQDIVWPDPI